MITISSAVRCGERDIENLLMLVLSSREDFRRGQRSAAVVIPRTNTDTHKIWLTRRAWRVETLRIFDDVPDARLETVIALEECRLAGDLAGEPLIDQRGEGNDFERDGEPVLDLWSGVEEAAHELDPTTEGTIVPTRRDPDRRAAPAPIADLIRHLWRVGSAQRDQVILDRSIGEAAIAESDGGVRAARRPRDEEGLGADMRIVSAGVNRADVAIELDGDWGGVAMIDSIDEEGMVGAARARSDP